MPETTLHPNQISIIVGSSNPRKLAAVQRAMACFFDPTLLVMTSKDTPSGVNSQPIGLEETKRGALNRMRACFPKHDLLKKQTVVVGLENGMIPGKELSSILPGSYSEAHWYDLGIVAVTVFNQGSSFTYVSYACPLQIPNDETKGMLPPEHVDDVTTNIEKYRANIMPLIKQGKDLYAVFSENRLSREETLYEACQFAMQRLHNIHIHPANQPIQPVDTVVTFGCFDLFHPLHQRLIDLAYTVGRQVVVYVYNKEYKKKGSQRIALTDNVQQRLTHIVEYALDKDKRITVLRMPGKHLSALNKAIKTWSKQGSVAVFGGDDQFSDYPELLDLCYNLKTPIVTIDRGDNKDKLCSSDLREQQSYQRTAAIYHADLTHVSPAFWKKRIHSKKQAKAYLAEQVFLGAGRLDIMKYNRAWPIDQRITRPCVSNDKILICLPGRTPSTFDRVRKILQTLDDLIPESWVSRLQRYLVCYEEDGRKTGDYIDALAQDPKGYFSDEAMEIARCLIMPRVSSTILIRREENNWCIHKPDLYIKKPWPELLHDLSQVTLWARSRGSVMAIEIENAFYYCMLALEYSHEEIQVAAQHIGVVSVSNLASLEHDRLFTTVSVTGTNDQVAQTYIPGFAERIKVIADKPMIEITRPSVNHCAVLAEIPNQIITDRGVHIRDEKCHYTPLYITLRHDSGSNELPLLVRGTIGKMLSREKLFDVTTIERSTTKSLSQWAPG